jgi:hypothetical protein
VAIRDLHERWFGRSRPLPRVIETASPREYAAVIAVEPLKEIRRALGRCGCVFSGGGAGGVGLLSADRSAFIQSVRLLPSIDSKTVWLATMIPHGRPWSHTWTSPTRTSADPDVAGLVDLWAEWGR